VAEIEVKDLAGGLLAIARDEIYLQYIDSIQRHLGAAFGMTQSRNIAPYLRFVLDDNGIVLKPHELRARKA
jgi:hypothetical protein